MYKTSSFALLKSGTSFRSDKNKALQNYFKPEADKTVSNKLEEKKRQGTFNIIEVDKQLPEIEKKIE